MKSWKALLAGLLLCGSYGLANSGDDKAKDTDRMQNAGAVMQQILDVQEDIPQDVLDKARCVAVIPAVVKAALVAGGSFGRGVMICRTGKNYDGPWGAPAMYALEGGSVGLQIGGESTDFVILVMNEQAAESVLRGKVQFGGDASIVAGPKGRTDTATTDTSTKAQFLSYSHTRGAFLGVALEGLTLHPDDDANQRVYGNGYPAAKILASPAADAPAAGKPLIARLEKASPEHK